MKTLKKILINFIKSYYRIFELYFKFKNRYKSKVLIYTDSRGFNVIGRYGRSFIGTYIQTILRSYNTDYVICPQKHTTILDFLEYLSVCEKSYDYVILHCGVVDFSPRPLSNIQEVYSHKKKSPIFLSLKEEMNHYYASPSSVLYNNEQTINLYSKDYLNNNVIPQLLNITNLIWINSNRFVSGWDGNYTKGRPLNIQTYIDEFDSILMSKIPNIIDTRVWTDSEIKDYTIDNIHYTKKGFNQISKMLIKKLSNV